MKISETPIFTTPPFPDDGWVLTSLPIDGTEYRVHRVRRDLIGAVGPGVAEGGGIGQSLIKSGTNNFETGWGDRVASVALDLPGALFDITSPPVTIAGTLSAALKPQPQNTFFAAPSGAVGIPGFRTLAAIDIPIGRGLVAGSGQIHFGTDNDYLLGAVPFASSPTNIGFAPLTFVWDNTNTRLGIGTAVPQYALDITSGSVSVQGEGSESIDEGFQLINNDGSFRAMFQLGSTGSTDFWNYDGAVWERQLSIDIFGSASFRGNLSSGKMVATGTVNFDTLTAQTLTNTAVGFKLLTGGTDVGTKNWGIAISYNAFGDLVINESNVQGGNPLDPATGTVRLQILSGGNVVTGGSFKTGNPSGGTAQPWKLGSVAVVSPTAQNRTIEVDINGTTYYLTAKTTND